jgi:hypothetical protein
MASIYKCNKPGSARTAALTACGTLALLCFAGMPARADEAGGEIPVCVATPANAAQSRSAPNNVRLVTGAPYSAMGTSETIITTPDGGKVVRQNTVRVWRDSDGRTRSEYELTSIGGPTPVEINSRLTVIDDPAARERYMLQPDGKVITVPIAPCRPASEPDVTVGPPRPARLPLKVSAPVRLGERMVGGETVTGSRVEATIPAGAMGNERPVKMSAEQWYGKDLQVVVEATYKDPRTGETKYRLREIQRDEPDARLFRPESAPAAEAAPPPRRRR